MHSSDDHGSNFHRKADIGNYNSINESQNNDKKERNDEILLSWRYQSRQISLGWVTSYVIKRHTIRDIEEMWYAMQSDAKNNIEEIYEYKI